MKRKNILIYIIIAIVVISGILFYAFRNKDEAGKEIIISKENTRDYICDKYEDGFITYNGVELIHYDSDMEQKWVCAVDEVSSDVYVDGKYVIIYSENNKIVIVKDGKILSEIKSEKDLRRASVNENGYNVLLTSDRGYKGQCFVYDSKASLAAEFSFGEKYILGAYLMADNRTLVMNVIDDKDDGYKGKILYADIKNGEIIKEIESDSIYSYMKIYKGKVFAENDGRFYCYDKNGNEKWSYEVDSEEIVYIGFSGNYVSMVVKAKDSFGANEILTFNLSGRLKGSYLTESQVTAFDASKGYAAVCVNGKVLLLNRRGKVVSEIETDTNTVNSIKLFKDDDRVLMISEKAVMQKFGR